MDASAPQPTFVFFLWRHHGTTREEFASYYNEKHLAFLTSLGIPLPSVHERSFPFGDEAIMPAGTRREGMFSFDSFTAVRFDSDAEYERRLNVLKDEEKRARAEADEDTFTQREFRVTYAAEAEGSSTTEYEELASSAVNVLQIVRRRPGLDRSTFKAAYEQEHLEAGPVTDALRHKRYYVLPEHPFSYSRGAWGDEPQRAVDVMHDVAFRDQEQAERGIAQLREAAKRSEVIDDSATVMFTAWRASGTPQDRTR